MAKKMDLALSPVSLAIAQSGNRECYPTSAIQRHLSRANSNASGNTYIALDSAFTFSEAIQQEKRAQAESKPILAGVPVSLKDCFDLSGFPTSSGSQFYSHVRGPAISDSAVAVRLRASGAVIIGKTHMHQIAYGLTGQSRDYGDCLQPADSSVLTGGSSSGAAASVQEESAVAAIGTDTGGSIRLPAAICGLAGYRASIGLGDWRGGYHIAPSFDTIGWIFQDLRDAPILGRALFDLSPDSEMGVPSVGIIGGEFLEECEPAVRQSVEEWAEHLKKCAANVDVAVPQFWEEALEIYALIQAYEAARLHSGFFKHFESDISERLEWGASISDSTMLDMRKNQQSFCTKMKKLFCQFDFLLAPITPISRLSAGADHTELRSRILRQNAPVSVAGLPAIVLPSINCGVQLIADRYNDWRLLQFASTLGKHLAHTSRPI
jgi:Asp-tRNA(Asn)/Glu-tRNA(Gln) amidotransferase A subunit family amidase